MAKASDYGVESVLEVVNNVFGLEGTPRGVEYDMYCVNPKHLDSSPSCSVNLNTGYWNCFSCGVGGDLVELGAMALGKKESEVRGLITPTSPEAKLVALRRKVANMQYKRPVRKRRLELPEYPLLESHPELEKRLFTADTIAKWKLGWVDSQQLTGHKGDYTIKKSIAIPIMDEHGHNMAWCYRRTDDSPGWQPRYLYTPGVEISELWFGLYHHARTRHVTVVEGALDAMWMDQCGFPALALLGSKMGERKIMWLQNYEQITLFPDYDNAGAQWRGRVTDMVGRRMPVRCVQYRPWMMKKTPEPDGTYRQAKDPEELRPVDIEIMHAAAPLVSAQAVRSLTTQPS